MAYTDSGHLLPLVADDRVTNFKHIFEHSLVLSFVERVDACQRGHDSAVRDGAGGQHRRSATAVRAEGRAKLSRNVVGKLAFELVIGAHENSISSDGQLVIDANHRNIRLLEAAFYAVKLEVQRRDAVVCRGLRRTPAR